MLDRLAEFQKCCDIFSGAVGGEPPPPGGKPPPEPLAVRQRRYKQSLVPSALAVEARGITHALSKTGELMGRLEANVRRSGGAFDDATQQVIDETTVVGRWLAEIETSMRRLEEASKGAGVNSTTRKHWEVLVTRMLLPRFQQLQKRFKNINTMRVKSLQSMHDRHKHFVTSDIVRLDPSGGAGSSGGAGGAVRPHPPPGRRGTAPTSRASDVGAPPATSSIGQLPFQRLYQRKPQVPPGPGVTPGAAAPGHGGSYYPSADGAGATTGAAGAAATPGAGGITGTYYGDTSGRGSGATANYYTSQRSNAPGALPGPGSMGGGMRRRGGGGSVGRTGGASAAGAGSVVGGRVADNPYARGRGNPYASGGVYATAAGRAASYSTRPPSQNEMGMGGGGGSMMSQRFTSKGRVDSRLADAKKVAQQFAQIGEMTQQLAEIVEEQDVFIEDLETEINEAHGHVERGQNELLKLWKNVSGDRGLMIKVFALLMFFIVLFFWIR